MLRLLALLPCVTASLNALTFSNTAFAGPGTSTLPASLSAQPLPRLSSLRVTGAVSPAQPELILFSLAFSPRLNGSALLWIDDHLILDSHATGLTAFINFSFVFCDPLPPLRLDIINASPAPTSVTLVWQGNFTASQPVPPSALTPYVAPFAQQREALRERMAAPPWQWGTYFNPSMTTHVALPSAFAVEATLGRVSTGATLGNIFVFRRASPAIVKVGGHGYDGSNWTEVSIGFWEGTACSVVLQTTLGVQGELFVLATANGTACSDLAVVFSFPFLWGRVGGVQGLAPGHVRATPAGLAPIDVFAAAPTVPFPKPPSTPYLAFALQGGQSAGLSAGGAAPAALADIQQRIAAAKAGYEADLEGRFSDADLRDAYNAQQSVISWNTMFTPYEGVVTPVSRGWDHGAGYGGYVLFDWDNLFLAWMAALEEPSKDIAYSNLIQIVQSRTQEGFIPNYASGVHKAYDRSEPQLGAFILREVYLRWGEDWVVQLLIDTLLGWVDWVWTKRTHTSPGGPLVVLGDDAFNFPQDEGGLGTLGRAALESGIDNGVAYILDPDADFDKATLRMKQWDVGASALFVSECQALMELAVVGNRSAAIPLLRQRAAAVQAAMDAVLWNEAEGVYENTAWNGTWNKRRMPTAFYPLLTGNPSAERAAQMLPLLTSPSGFCVNDTAFGAGTAASTFLLQFTRDSAHLSGASQATIAEAIDGRFLWARVEALVEDSPTSRPGAATTPLTLFFNGASGEYATAANASAPGTPPAPGFAPIRREGFCFQAPAPDLVPLTLWSRSSSNSSGEGGVQQFLTCGGNPACALEASKAGFHPAVGAMCYGFNATLAEHLPCKFGCASTTRSDPAFFQNDYWRGRIWGPQVALVWLGLKRYDALAPARDARAVLVQQALALELQEWRLFRQVTENMNGIFGVGEDVANADPFYHVSSPHFFLFTFLFSSPFFFFLFLAHSPPHAHAPTLLGIIPLLLLLLLLFLVGRTPGSHYLAR